jgi:hypothetical protein
MIINTQDNFKKFNMQPPIDLNNVKELYKSFLDKGKEIKLDLTGETDYQKASEGIKEKTTEITAKIEEYKQKLLDVTTNLQKLKEENEPDFNTINIKKIKKDELIADPNTMVLLDKETIAKNFKTGVPDLIELKNNNPDNRDAIDTELEQAIEEKTSNIITEPTFLRQIDTMRNLKDVVVYRTKEDLRKYREQEEKKRQEKIATAREAQKKAERKIKTDKLQKEIDDLKVQQNTIINKLGNGFGAAKINILTADQKVIFGNPDSYNQVRQIFQGTATPKQKNVILEIYSEDAELKQITDHLREKNEELTEITAQQGGSGIAESNGYITEITKGLSKYNQLTLDLKKIFSRYWDVANEYNKYVLDLKYYQLFMISSSTKRMEQSSQIYQFISQGAIQYYRDITKRILAHFDDAHDLSIQYFKKFHNFLIHRMHNFFDWIMSNTYITISDKIEVDQCTGLPRDYLLLFNSFKDILESYKETNQYPVSIFARINNWLDAANVNSGKNDKNNIFTVEKNSDTLKNDVLKCKNLSENKDDITHQTDYTDLNKGVKFTNVFGSEQFEDNNTISMFMGLGSQLAMGKGTTLITYGYSGTGKTYTLFGSTRDSSKGLLQSTLENIRGDDKTFYGRIFELYGMGFQYKFYWDDQDKIYQRIFNYNLVDSDNENLKTDGATTLETTEQRTKFVNKVSGFNINTPNTIPETYKEINQAQLNNFDKVVEEIDDIRKKEGRIKCTKNNIVSSRGIIIYDFMIKTVDDNGIVKFTPFLIIDLPGKEEIVDSFVKDPRYHLLPQEKATANLAISSSLFLNPLMATILDIDDVNVGHELIEYCKINNKDIYSTFSSNHKAYKMVNNNKYEQVGISSIKPTGLISDHTDKEVAIIAHYEAIELMKYLIKERKVDIIIIFLTSLVNKIKKIQLGSVDKKQIGEFCSVGNLINQKIYLLEEYVRASFEGIYINENINGLILYLLRDVLNKNPDFIKKQTDKSQIKYENDIAWSKDRNGTATWKTVLENAAKGSETSGFDVLSYDARLLYRDRVAGKEECNDDDKYYNTIFKRNEESYKSDRVYMFEKPLIASILDPYLTQLKNFYVFYLLSNNDAKDKCTKQLYLLNNSLPFIKLLDQTS